MQLCKKSRNCSPLVWGFTCQARFFSAPFQREVRHLQVVGIVVKNRCMMRCGQETTTVPMRRNEGTRCHDQKLPSFDLRRTMPSKESKEERTFKGLDCATPDTHLRSDYTLIGMRAGCCTSDWKWGFCMSFPQLKEVPGESFTA